MLYGFTRVVFFLSIACVLLTLIQVIFSDLNGFVLSLFSAIIFTINLGMVFYADYIGKLYNKWRIGKERKRAHKQRYEIRTKLNLSEDA